MRSARATAPSRIDLAGGTLDIWPLHHAMPEAGITVNAAVDVPARAEVEVNADGSPGIRLVSRDLGSEAAYADLAALDAACAARTCALPLLSEAVRAVAPETGLTLSTHATGPAGAGLGGSSALLAAVLGALFVATGRDPDPRAIQALGQGLETRLLRKPTGYQDYYPPLLGGCLALEGAVGGLRIERLDVDLEALAARLRLVYTGEPHVSGDTNWRTYRAYFDGEAHTVNALHELASISRRMRDSLRAGDLETALDLVVDDGTVRRRMAPGVDTPGIQAIDAAVRAAGARGTNVCGAGGGGCVLVVLAADTDPEAVDAALRQRLVAEGLRVEPL